jgi:hypothetical protein
MGANAVTILIIIGSAVVGVVVIVVIVALIAALVLRLMKAPLEARIAARYAGEEILLQDLRANSFGLESAGVWQVRGNGALVLTATSLHFFMFLPRKEVCVPLESVIELSITKSHLGKATLHDLLKVRFHAEGKEDSIAWYLADPHGWKARIEELTAK